MLWSLGFAVWTFANPPSGTPGTTSGLISVLNNNIGIGTVTPAAPLDIDGKNNTNGAVIIRNGFLNMNGNNINMNTAKIIGLKNPTDPQDAATKDYVDKNPSNGNGNGSPSKVWGEGRPGIDVINNNGECIVNDIKISRSTQLTSWNGSAAACPKKWWVCKASERGNNLCAYQFSNKTIISCVFDINGNNFASASSQKVWVSDGTGGAYPGKGAFISATGGATDYEPVCSLMPVWCCTDVN